MNEPRKVTHVEPTKEAITKAATNPSLVELRYQLAEFSSEQLRRAGEMFHVLGHLLGSDRRNGKSPFSHGSDETVAVALLFRIASQITSASAHLFKDGRNYAAAALLRQMVEVEYLSWAFETRDGDAEKWLRSSEQERQEFFRPAILRKVANGKFRSKDYGYHCELGGHPVPKATILLDGNISVAQLLISDLLGHTGNVWDHLAGWARLNGNEQVIFAQNQAMSARFAKWKEKDPLVNLPPP